MYIRTSDNNRKNRLHFCLPFLVFVSTLVCSHWAHAIELKLQQVLIDGVNAIDGLDNPRKVKVSADGKTVFVISADDNSLLILNLDKKLRPLQLFKNSENKKLKLEGASGIVSFNNGKNLAVTSFYDSAITLFNRVGDQSFNFTNAVSDNLGYQRIFKGQESLVEEDKLGLLGTFDLAVTQDETQLFAASYKSNAVSVFHIDANAQLTHKQKFTLPEDGSGALGYPVSLSFSEQNNHLVVAGYEGNSLSVLSRNADGTLSLDQTIRNESDGVENLVKPQKLIHSENEQYLYAACTGSNSILVFEFNDGRYTYLKSVTQSDTGGTGLAGVGSLAFSSDGSQLYAAGEFDSGLLLFNVAKDGKLAFNKKLQHSEHQIEGVTSIATTQDNRLLVTLGKMDALYLFEIQN